jgi:hypothetical protein
LARLKLGVEDFLRILVAPKPTGIFSALARRDRPLADTFEEFRVQSSGFRGGKKLVPAVPFVLFSFHAPFLFSCYFLFSCLVRWLFPDLSAALRR